MINYIRIDHVHITVPEGKVDEAQQFYANVLGFENMSRAKELSNSSGYWFKVAGIEFHIDSKDDVAKGRQHFALEIGNIDAAREHLTANGVNIIEQTPILGRQRFMFKDPYGNRIEFLEFD
jgi:catechol 2,3-dioxygenase-like lactoylglutathione lyase family enzyme